VLAERGLRTPHLALELLLLELQRGQKAVVAAQRFALRLELVLGLLELGHASLR